MNKYNNIKAICRIPRPRITPAAARNTPEQSIEMNVIEPIQEMNNEQILQETIANPFHLQAFNITKYNKNLISFSGIFIIIVLLVVMGVFAVGSRSSWISHIQAQTYVYINFCCLPVVLPTIYFIQKPNHLVVAMKDLNLL